MLKVYRADESKLEGVQKVSFFETVNSDTDLRPGCVSSAYIEAEAYGAQDTAPGAGDELFLFDTQSDVTSKIGVFFAEPSIRTKNSYTFKAYDAVKKLDADFSIWLKANQAAFPMTVYALVSAACTVAGVTLGSASWPLSDHEIEAFSSDSISCRDILHYAAEIACRFVRCNSDGELIFDWYSEASNMRIYPTSGTSGDETRYAYRQDGLTYEKYETAALARVAVHCSGIEDDAYVYPDDVGSGNTLHIRNNLLLTGADDTFYMDVAENIYTGISAVGTYRPFEVNVFSNENPFRAGQIVAVTDSQGVSFSSVIMAMSVSEGATLTSTGNEEYADSTDTARALNQLAQTVQQLSEDTSAELSDIRTETSASIQNITDAIKSTVEESYYPKSYIDQELFKVNTEISQTAHDITISFNSLLDDTSSELYGEFETLYSYIQLAGGTITLGEAGSDIQLKIDNDRIKILVAGEAVTYWTSEAFISPKSLEIPEGGRLVLGNYAYVPRSNGSLDFVWVGE